eukprot:CAMPEP_0117519990 /NCGR_PEP_ID=MMETSP0784-20121206/32941_1 /TAXON_ID=39447 /ORGANISM="" /LENGTH=114 /DNA_ID=CAMNT_0005315977 /DNA_START=89 /DNA_END=430 /DNA_ORIENTATION=-
MAGDAEGGAAAAEEPEEKESMWKTCLYCCLDSIAVIVRTIVAIAFGIDGRSSAVATPSRSRASRASTGLIGGTAPTSARSHTWEYRASSSVDLRTQMQRGPKCRASEPANAARA